MANSKRERRPGRPDTRQAGHRSGRRSLGGAAARPGAKDGTLWLFGSHAVAAALENPRRIVRRLLVTGGDVESDAPPPLPASGRAAPVKVTREELERLLPQGAVHQGIAAEVLPLPETAVEDLCDLCADSQHAAIVVLDKVSDPRNVGAVLRSVAAFGGAGVIVPERGAPQESGTLAKAASGALERIPIVRVVNLKRSLETIKASGFWCIGLDASADLPLTKAPFGGRVALVLGAEGAGLRRLTREACDVLAKIPIRSEIESLNVSTATAIALYEWARTRG